MKAFEKVCAVSFVCIIMLSRLDAEEHGTTSARPATTESAGEVVIGMEAGTLPSDSRKKQIISVPALPKDAVGLGIRWPDGSTSETWSFVPQGEKNKFTLKGVVDSTDATGFVLSGKHEKDFGVVKLLTVGFDKSDSTLNMTWEDGGERAMLAYRVLAECQWLLMSADGKVVGRFSVNPEKSKIVEVSVGRSAAKSNDPVRVTLKGVPKGGEGIRLNPPTIDGGSGWNATIEPLAAEGRIGYAVKLQHPKHGALQLDVTFPDNNVIELTLSRGDALVKLDKFAMAEAKPVFEVATLQEQLRSEIAGLDKSIGITQDRINSYDQLSRDNNSSYYKDRMSTLKESLKNYTQQKADLTTKLEALNSEPALDPLTPLVLEMVFPLTQQKIEKVAILNVMLVNRPGDRRHAEPSVNGQTSENGTDSGDVIKPTEARVPSKSPAPSPATPSRPKSSRPPM